MDLTTQTNPGASNSTDFQPPTSNPQQVGGPDQSTSSSLQTGNGNPGSQEQLNLSTTSPLQVETLPATSVSTQTNNEPVATAVGFNPWPVIAVLAVIAVAAIIVYRRWNIFAAHTEPFLPPIELTPTQAALPNKPKKKPAPPKSRPKKKTKKKK
jgi:hypothetical protein